MAIALTALRRIAMLTYPDAKARLVDVRYIAEEALLRLTGEWP